MNIHACAFVTGRHGILVRGASGFGKSLLVEECLRDASYSGRFACWVADDQVALERHGAGLVAAAVPAIAGQRELRFAGIGNVAFLPRCRVDLVVDLVAGERLTRLPDTHQTICLGPGRAHQIKLALCHVPARDPTHGCHIIKHTLRAI